MSQIELKVDSAEIIGSRVNIYRGGTVNDYPGLQISVNLTEYQVKGLIDQLHEAFGEETLLAMVKDTWVQP